MLHFFFALGWHYPLAVSLRILARWFPRTILPCSLLLSTSLLKGELCLREVSSVGVLEVAGVQVGLLWVVSFEHHSPVWAEIRLHIVVFLQRSDE